MTQVPLKETIITTSADTKTDLEVAVEHLKAKTTPYAELFAYYDGNQKLKYNSKRFQNIFKNLTFDLTENWCSVVIDATANRVNLKSFLVKSDEKEKPRLARVVERIARRLGIKAPPAQEMVNEIADRNQIILESDVVHVVALVIGESFYIVWKDSETGKAEGFYNDPRSVHLFYEEENPRKKKFAVKWWMTNERRVRLILYYPDRLEYYSTKPVKNWSDVEIKMFLPTDDEGNETGEEIEFFPNEFDEVPVFQFRPDLRKVKSDLKNVIGPQDAINKLMADLMVTSEFSAFKQRYIISDTDTQGELKNAPGIVWDIPAGDGVGQGTTVGELSSSDPNVYLKPVNREVMAIGAITQTPSHLLMEKAGGQISGEALIVLESPINKKAQNRIDLFSPIWSEVMRFMLKVEGVTIEVKDITPIYDKPETIQPKTQAEIIQIGVNSGIPLVTQWREIGKTEAEIDQMLLDKEEAAATETKTLAGAILEAQRSMDNPELGEGLDVGDE